jgi:sec-independent protein translocase protein TatC
MQSTGQEATSYKLLAQRIKTLLSLLRSPIGLTLLTLILLSFGLIFWFSPQALNYLQHKFNQRFVFFSLSEPFLAMLKFSVVCLVIIFFPLVWLGVISTLDALLSLSKRLFFLFFIFGSNPFLHRRSFCLFCHSTLWGSVFALLSKRKK